ncbi:MAG TPA: hypothetical protein VGX02_02045 [Candidatus Eremiobacteraceae bacterium]|jgi:hypothetical protein|nr:hypothetical protein [Candidatus Eremiobacteraceae bacterium]
MRSDSIGDDRGGEPAEPKEPQKKKDESANERTQEGEIPPDQTKQGGTRPPVRGEDGPSDPGSREQS